MIRHFVIFGASGDLTARYLLPPLAQRHHAGKLPGKMTVIGAAPESWDTAHCQGHIHARLKKLPRYGSTGVGSWDYVLWRFLEKTTGAKAENLLGHRGSSEIAWAWSAASAAKWV